MNLVPLQHEFMLCVAKLIIHADSIGLQVTAGEMYRPQETQDLYYKQGRTKAKYSQHTKRLAIDIQVFKDGIYQTREEVYVDLGVYWSQLHPKARWGGGFSKIRDYNHFELWEK